MNTRLYVGNIPYSTLDGDLRELFSQYGQVTDAKVMIDRETDRPRGFGFVTMSAEPEALAAVTGLNESLFGGRKLIVNEARERTRNGHQEGHRSDGGPPSDHHDSHRDRGGDRRGRRGRQRDDY